MPEGPNTTFESQDLSRRIRLGWKLTFLSGLFPVIVATIIFARLFWSVEHPSGPWLAGGFAASNYTLESIRQFDEVLAKDLIMAQHMELANIINTGFMVLVISFFGLRRRQCWAWFTLLAIFLWVGLNDGMAFIKANQRPVPLLAEVIGLAGLAISWRPIFKGCTRKSSETN
jgi:hypothetical protein